MNIQSKFVKSELKKTKWENRKYIYDLLEIEGFVFAEHFGLGSGYLYVHLKNKYPKQWKAIWLELNPGEYHEIVELEEKDKLKLLELIKEKKLQTKIEKEDWKKMRGLE